MGGALSTAKMKQLKASQEQVIKLLMPVYYTEENLSKEEQQLAKECWACVISDKTPEFLSREGKSGFPYNSCAVFFYDSFYTRLFDIHPASRRLFIDSVQSQGRFLVKLIGLALSDGVHDNPELFDTSLMHLATVHFEHGVRAAEYGIIGEVLFWCLRKVAGEVMYTQGMHLAWMKIYSRMIRIMIPTVAALEMRHKYLLPPPTSCIDSIIKVQYQDSTFRLPTMEECNKPNHNNLIRKESSAGTSMHSNVEEEVEDQLIKKIEAGRSISYFMNSSTRRIIFPLSQGSTKGEYST